MTDNMKTEILKYAGKELTKEGVRKDKEGNEIKWKLFKLLFDVGGQYPRKFSSFDKLSDNGLQPKELEEGEFTNSYGTHESRQVVKVTPSTEEKAIEHKQKQDEKKEHTATAETPRISLPSEEEMQVCYEAMKSENPDLTLAEYVGGMVLMKEYMPELLNKMKMVFEINGEDNGRED